MSNREYWEKRMLALANRQKRKDGEIVSKLTQEYQKLSAGLDRELSAFYGRYAGSEGISMAEAKKLLKGVELENFRLSLEEFREKAVMGGYDQELNEIYLRSRVSRLQALKTQIGLRVRELAMGQRKQLQEHLTETVTDTYYRTVYEVQKGVGVAGNFAQFHTGMLESVLNGVWMAGNFSSRIWANQNKLIGELETVFSQGIVRGDSLEKMTKLLAQRMEVAKNRAATLVETESAHAAAEATAKGYEETEVEKYDFLATLDLKTCDVCGALDGKTFLVKERKTGVNYPPIHPRCHCTTIPHFDSNFTSGTRAARDLETGKTVQIPSMTYEQWREKYVTKSVKEQPIAEEQKVFSIESAIKNKKIEIGVIYDRDGKELLKKQGEADKIVLNGQEKLLLKNAIFTHNHPSNGPLSDGDIFNFWKYDMYEVRAVTSHGIFSVKRPEKWLREPLSREAMRDEFMSLVDEYRNPVLSRIKQGKLTWDEGEYLIQRIVMRRLTRSYGLKMELIKWK